MSYQKLTIVGRLGADPETKNVNDNYVANFSVATSKKWKNKAGETQESTEWHRCAAWGATAKVASDYLKKGSQVLVEGELQTRSWDDDQGVKRYATDVRVNRLVLLGSKQDQDAVPHGTSEVHPGVPNFASPQASFDTNEEMPF